MNTIARTDLQQLEREAQRLRAEFAGDLVACTVIRIDLAVRKLALRLMSIQ